MTAPGRAFGVVAVVAVAVSIGHFAYLSGFTSDDAAISYGYARAIGRGLPAGALNAADPPVEGYSNPTWTAALAVGEALGLRPDVGAKALGLTCAVGAALLFTSIVGRLVTDRRLRWAAVLVSVSFTHMFWAVSGLENVLIALLMLAVARLLLVERTTVRSDALLAAVLVLLALSRPEAPLYAAAGLLGRVLQTPRPSARRAVAIAAAVAVPLGVYYLWHARRFGGLVPNPVVAKSDGRSATDVVRDAFDLRSGGWHYVRDYLLSPVVLVLPWTLVGAAAAVRRRVPGLAALAVAALALPLAAGDWMEHHRFLSWFEVMALVLAVLGVDHAVATFGRRRIYEAVAAVTLGLYAVAALSWSARSRTNEFREMVTIDQVERSYRPFLADARRFGVSDGHFLIPDIGAFVYTLDRRIVDAAGLADFHIAHSGWDREILRLYLLDERRPELIHTHLRWSHLWGFDEMDGFAGMYLPLGRPDDYVRRDLVVRQATGAPPAAVFARGVAVVRAERVPGGVDVYWTALRSQVDAAVATVNGMRSEVGARVYPAGRWQPGEEVRQHVALARVGSALDVALEGEASQAVPVTVLPRPTESDLLGTAADAWAQRDVAAVTNAAREAVRARGRARPSPGWRRLSAELRDAAAGAPAAQAYRLWLAAATADPTSGRTQRALFDARRAYLRSIQGVKGGEGDERGADPQRVGEQ